jgi:hypothetical protein
VKRLLVLELLRAKRKSCINLAISYISKVVTLFFKELFALDGKQANLSLNDVQRRNRIVQLLSDWGLVGIVKTESIADIAPLSQIKVLSYKEKDEWTLESKYNIGKKKTAV